MENQYDVVIVGSGPNGLSAGIAFAQQGYGVCILEARDTVGGGMRTAECTLPGFRHDICSAIHPMGYSSPFLKTLPLKEYGLEWIIPPASVAHPLDEGNAVILRKSVEETAENLGIDSRAYLRLINPFLKNPEGLISDALKPLGIPKNPGLFLRFGLRAFQPASFFTRQAFKEERARALFAGCAAHSVLPFDKFFTTAVGLIFLLTAHMENWAFPKGGSQNIANAMAAYFKNLGGELQLSTRIEQFGQLPKARKYLFDTDPIQMAAIATDQLPPSYKRRLNAYHFGPGAFKIDFALSEPIPWKDPDCLLASTVHVGGTLDEIAESEKSAWEGKICERPYVLVSQQSQFDETRAPTGKHTGWAYCHVPNGSGKDMTEAIEKQIERFAPGFRDTILAKKTMSPADFMAYNPNYAGGAITGGAADITQLFTRPVIRVNPYSTPHPDIYICSASTPPGGGVHGMCGYHAAKSVLKTLRHS